MWQVLIRIYITRALILQNYLPTLPGKEVKIIVEVDENTVNNKLVMKELRRESILLLIK